MVQAKSFEPNWVIFATILFAARSTTSHFLIVLSFKTHWVKTYRRFHKSSRTNTGFRPDAFVFMRGRGLFGLEHISGALQFHNLADSRRKSAMFSA
jgi:hypothetical protein